MVKIQNRELAVPIIQGGMGVGVSLSSLAGHVAKCGGMGVISAAHAGYDRENFETDTLNQNLIGLDDHIQKAKKNANGNGLIGVNIMFAINDYDVMVKQAVKSKADAIISGAGIPLHLPKLVEGSDILIAPIVSSGRVMGLILKTWDKKYHRAPDFVVIEGAKAGGHLGFKIDDLKGETYQSNEQILADVLEVLKPYEEKYERTIPVFIAGGVYTNKDIQHFLDLGASGVQIATRFIATHECDAADAYKQMFVNCKEEDIVLTKSPVGMPGRAMNNKFVESVNAGNKVPVTRCFRCIKTCDVKTTPYCISRALIEAVKGNVDHGLVFCGSNACRIDKIMSVQELMEELMEGVNV